MIEVIIKFAAKTAGAIAGFNQVGVAATGLGGKLKGVGGQMQALGGKAALISAPIGAALGVATTKAIGFSTAMDGASRSLDLSAEETKKMKDEALKLAPPLGLLPTKFAELATEAGRLGVAKDAIIGFATVVAEIAAITDLSEQETEDLAKSFAALQTITGMTTEDLNIFGAAVNKLDDSVGGTTPNIIEFTRQTAATGKLLGLGAKELAAYGATMQSLGIQNGVAYRSFNSLLTKLASPQVLSLPAKKAFGDLGLTTQEMANIMTTDATAGIDLFLRKINEIAEVDVSRALGAVNKIVGADYGDEILTIASSTDKLREALGYVGDEMDQANLAKKSDELAKKLSNVKGQQMILNAQLERFWIIIGEAVLPTVTDFLGDLTPLVDKIAAFAQANPGIVKVGMAIAAVGVSAAPVLLVLGSLTSVVGSLVGGVKFLAPFAIKAGVALAGITAPAWALWGACIAVGVALGALIIYWDDVTRAIANSTFFQDWHNGWQTLVINTQSAFTNLGNWIKNNWQGVLRGLVNPIESIGFLFYKAGAALMGNFFNGINAYFKRGIDYFKQQLAYLRGMLPGSEPRIPSPLSNLADAGAATMQNFASGFNAANGNISPGLQQTRASLAPAIASSSSGGGGIIVNDNRTINLGLDSEGVGNIDIIEILRKSDRELLDLLNKARARWGRGT